VPISNEVYAQKEGGYRLWDAISHSGEGITSGADNPHTPSEFRQVYGKLLRLRGIGQGITYLNNFRSLAEVKLRTRLVSVHAEPVIETDLFGHRLSMPVLGAPMSGLSLVSSITEEGFATGMLEGCKFAGMIGCTGHATGTWPVHPGIVALRNVGGHGIPIFKPLDQAG
jgi:hypothetical protein